MKIILTIVLTLASNVLLFTTGTFLAEDIKSCTQLRECFRLFNKLPIKLCFINVCTHPNLKHTPHSDVKIAFIVIQGHK